MSFRGRLTLFFVLIVIVPMISVTVVIFSLISDNESGKSNAAVAARLDVATKLAQEAQQEAARAGDAIGNDRIIATGLRRDDRAMVQRRAEALLTQLRLTRLLIFGTDRHAIADAGRDDAVFPASLTLKADGEVVGTLQVSVQTAGQFTGLVQTVTTLNVVVRRRGHVLASTLPGVDPTALPTENGKVKVGDD